MTTICSDRDRAVDLARRHVQRALKRDPPTGEDEPTVAVRE
jgi:hypothetical protein